MVEISTDRLILRGAEASDAVALHEPFSDPEVMRYWSEVPHRSQERTNEWVDGMIESDQNGITDFIICLKPEKKERLTSKPKPIGKIGVWQENEIGFLLARSQWHKGLALEALRGILHYLFETKGFEDVIADTDPRNAASIGLLKKLGFEEYDFKKNTLEIGGEWVDSLYLKLKKAQFEQP